MGSLGISLGLILSPLVSKKCVTAAQTPVLRDGAGSDGVTRQMRRKRILGPIQDILRDFLDTACEFLHVGDIL